MCSQGSGCVPLSGLPCVRGADRACSAPQVWHLRLTIHCLADAGNMLDCACLAGVVALKHFRRPEVEVLGDEVTVVRPPPLHLLPR